MFGEPVVTNSCAFYIASEAAGALIHPAFPAPSVWEAERFLKHSEALPRGNADTCSRLLVIASVSEAIQSFVVLDCFVACAPRNDGAAV